MSVRGEALNFLFESGIELPQKMIQEHPDIVASIGQPRQMQPDHVEPEQKILPESTFANHLFQVPVRRGNDPHINMNTFCGSERVQDFVIQE